MKSLPLSPSVRSDTESISSAYLFPKSRQTTKQDLLSQPDVHVTISDREGLSGALSLLGIALIAQCESFPSDTLLWQPTEHHGKLQNTCAGGTRSQLYWRRGIDKNHCGWPSQYYCTWLWADQPIVSLFTTEQGLGSLCHITTIDMESECPLFLLACS